MQDSAKLIFKNLMSSFSNSDRTSWEKDLKCESIQSVTCADIDMSLVQCFGCQKVFSAIQKDRPCNYCGNSACYSSISFKVLCKDNEVQRVCLECVSKISCENQTTNVDNSKNMNRIIRSPTPRRRSNQERPPPKPFTPAKASSTEPIETVRQPENSSSSKPLSNFPHKGSNFINSRFRGEGSENGVFSSTSDDGKVLKQVVSSKNESTLSQSTYDQQNTNLAGGIIVSTTDEDISEDVVEVVSLVNETSGDGDDFKNGSRNGSAHGLVKAQRIDSKHKSSCGTPSALSPPAHPPPPSTSPTPPPPPPSPSSSSVLSGSPSSLSTCTFPASNVTYINSTFSSIVNKSSFHKFKSLHKPYVRFSLYLFFVCTVSALLISLHFTSTSSSVSSINIVSQQHSHNLNNNFTSNVNSNVLFDTDNSTLNNYSFSNNNSVESLSVEGDICDNGSVDSIKGESISSSESNSDLQSTAAMALARKPDLVLRLHMRPASASKEYIRDGDVSDASDISIGAASKMKRNIIFSRSSNQISPSPTKEHIIEKEEKEEQRGGEEAGGGADEEGGGEEGGGPAPVEDDGDGSAGGVGETVANVMERSSVTVNGLVTSAIDILHGNFGKLLAKLPWRNKKSS